MIYLSDIKIEMRRKKHSNCKFSYSRNLYYICATINLSLIEFFDYAVGISHPLPIYGIHQSGWVN